MKFLHTLRHWIGTHKKTSGSIIIVLAITGYALAKNASTASGETRYVLTNVATGTIVSSISGSGQVAASNQVDLQAKASGTVTSVGARAGQSVKKGDLLVQIDARDAANALETAKLSLEKLLRVDPQTKLQQEHALDEQTQSLVQTYTDGRTTVAKALLDIPTVASGLDALYGNGGYLSYQKTGSLSNGDRALVTAGDESHSVALSSLQTLKKEYAALSSSDDTADTDKLLADTLATLQTFNTAVASAHIAVERIASDQADAGPSDSSVTTRADIASWTNTVSADASSITSTQNTIIKTKNSIQESTQTLADLVDGPDPLDIRAAQLAVQQKQEAYDDYFIRAPFDGTVASLSAQVGQSASGTLGTLITQTKIATITLNEVDVAKVALDQKATLVFDAIDGLTLTGTVAEIDTLGTVSQGVVNYTVKIAFDTQDDRVRPGMSVTASIITDAKADVLTVPNSAVKTGNGGSYVLVLDNPGTVTAGVQGVTSVAMPTQVPVDVGIADTANTEIISGLTDGEQIVAKIVTQSAAVGASPSAPSLLGGGGAARGPAAGAGATRSFGR